MIIRLEFKKDSSVETEDTRQTLTGSPSGSILDSTNCMNLRNAQINNNAFVFFYYLDEIILNTRYCGVAVELDGLRRYDGVKSVTIIDAPYNRQEIINSYDSILDLLLKYL